MLKITWPTKRPSKGILAAVNTAILSLLLGVTVSCDSSSRPAPISETSARLTTAQPASSDDLTKQRAIERDNSRKKIDSLKVQMSGMPESLQSHR